jgi:xylulokinase
MAAEPTLVGLDVGTTGVKAVAVSPSGEVVARAERSYPLSTPQPGWSEQVPDDWWRAGEEALAALGVRPTAVGLSGQMHGLVALDARERPLRPAILWNDQRTAAECEEIEERVGRERLIALTGNRALTGFTAPKLLWLRRHERDVYTRIEHVLLPKDYVRLRLTGERAIDVADASGTLLFDVAARRWSDEVLDALEVPPEWLPPVYESPAVPGMPGAGDQAAAALGVGIDAPGPVSVVLGTSGVVFAALPSYAADPEGRVHAFCHAVPGGWHAMGVMLSAAGSLRWLRDAVGGSYEELVAEAERWPPGVEGLVFLPYLAGERTPHADPDARGAFVGLSVRHDRGALVRAVLEGVAFGLRDSLELLRELGVDAVVGRASGGGARSRLWLRIVASVLGLPLELTAVEEGSAYGAALLAGVSAGVFEDVHHAVRSCVRVRARIEPEPDWGDPYNEQYQRFRALYPALRATSGGQTGDSPGTVPGQTGDRPGTVPETRPVRT